MKKFIATCMAGVMLMSSPVFAEGIVYNGEAITYSSQEPVIIDGRTYVPIRDVFEKLGFSVNWDADNKIVTINNDYYNFILTTVTSKLIYMDVELNISGTELENSVKIINDKTMLPLREILEKANYELEWDAETKTTTIIDKNDYVKLNETLEKLNAEDTDLTSLSEVYKVDTTKPVGKLTEEEKAYLLNMINMEKEDLTDEIDLEGMTSTQAEYEVNKLIDKYYEVLDEVPCPDSLKEIDALVRESYEKMGGLMVHNVKMEELLEGETDAVKEELGFSIGMLSLGSLIYIADELNDAVNNFYAERNIDVEAELGISTDTEFEVDMEDVEIAPGYEVNIEPSEE